MAGGLSAAALLLTLHAAMQASGSWCMHDARLSSGQVASNPGNGHIDPARLFLSIPSTGHLRKHLEYYASGTHVAGINRTQAEHTRDYFAEHGIDAKIVEYYPWLNYPVGQRVALFNESTQRVLFEAGLKEDVVPGDPSSEDPNNLPAFHGYSADGNVTGKLVYANYGTVDDFKALKAAGVNIKDKIVLIRYGNVLRGLKVYGAELHGARGVLIYSDPADDGYARGKVYPAGPWRPDSSLERGSVSLIQIYPGDPLTPGHPATKDAPRLDPRDAKNLNTIPSLPLSYRDAEPLLRALVGFGKNASDISEDWVGGLASKGVQYWTGPSALSVNLMNRVEFKTTPIQNVIGRIKGWEDSERTVIIGNHRDAWCAGASDPSSGSAVLLELVRAFGELAKLGWRPRRTVVLASWDAEEYGLVGSTEWVEENVDWIRADVISYINVDAAVMGPDFYASASPIFKDLLYEVTKQVPYPGSANQTVYDAWLSHPASELVGGEPSPGNGSAHKYTSGIINGRAPLVRSLGSGSDFTAFMAHAGVSSLHLGFGTMLGTYHSNYDSLKWMTTFVDPDFELHRAMARICGLLVIHLADDPVLGLNPVSYAKSVGDYIHEAERQMARQTPARNDSTRAATSKSNAFRKLHRLRAAQRQLMSNARLVEQSKHRLRVVYGEDCQMAGRRRRMNCRKLRKSINDRASKLERHFIDPEGLPGREWYKHTLVGPGRWLGYDAQVFPALLEAAEDHKWNQLRQREKRAAELIYDAAWFLREV
ncbi:Vacuolar protein sorting-associated protein 70 [Coemansia thaxteri]|uniref:Vacuolar protein sorting-associated protein 70 n=1 Tax=Coemansia thaxteri TaxID=2663907 RepID=A0A9W8EHP6_9FUNG|nr:Vacuolar protein sorting-associated protein 70 [Coemansia thaxteri]